MRGGDYPGLSRWALNVVACTLVREVEGDFTHTEDKAACSRKRRLEGCGHKPRDASSHQELEEARNACSPEASGGNVDLITP